MAATNDAVTGLGVRPAEVADAERVSGLILELSARFIFPDFTPEGRDRFTAAHRPGAIAKLIEAGYRYQLAESGSALAGLVAMRERSHLYHLFVAEPLQRTGLGRHLWEIALRDAVPDGSACRITVNASRNAVPVYERFGFVASSGPVMREGVLSVPMVFERAASDPGR